MNLIRLLLLNILIIPICAFSQPNIWKTGYTTICVEDTAKSAIIYVHIANDRKTNRQRVKYELLSIGDRMTVYRGYGNHQMDSVFSTFTHKPTFDEAMRLGREYEPIRESLTIDRSKGILDFYGKVFINSYRYFEPIPEIEWMLTDETEEILGYKCHKATAKWRGREWNAWYSDIPIDAGPWKFQGLPGLVLKVEDTEGDHSIYAIDIRNEVYPIGHPYKSYCKTTREKYNAAKEDYAVNSNQILLNSGMVTVNGDDKKKLLNRRRFYAPLELK